MMATKRGILLLVAAVVLAPASRAQQPVLLRNVNELRFEKGREVLKAREDEYKPQLECAYNPLRDEAYQPSEVTCYNRGTDSRGVVLWECAADLDSSLELDNAQVMCEGDKAPDDAFVNLESCSLLYTLKLAQQPQQASPINNNNNNNKDNENNEPQNQNRYMDESGRPHYYRQEEQAAEQEVRVISVWSFSNVLLLVLVFLAGVRCVLRFCKRTPLAAATTNTNPNTVENHTEERGVENYSNNQGTTKRSTTSASTSVDY